jgi:excisionase family DNA binding protein
MQSKKEKAYGTHEAANICNVTPPTIIRWMEEGKLPFFTTAGKHRRIWAVDLAAFMKTHNIPVPPEIGTPKGLKFLIVEDEKDSRLLLQRILRKAYPGAVIEEAKDGFEAGYKLHALRPTLVILDLNLPRVNGLKICELIRADAQLRDVKVLAITAFSVEEQRKLALAAGANDFLSKPFTVEALKEKLAGLMGS